MSHSQSYVDDKENQQRVLSLYCDDPSKPTLNEIALRLGTRYANVQRIVSRLSKDEMHAQKVLRYSRSKQGDANPMRHKSGPLHHNYKGEVADGYGYLQEKIGERYVFTHRLVMERSLGMEPGSLAPEWAVHHVDGDKHNNDLNNLALLSSAAHSRLHALLSGKKLRYRA
jgi:hypothetical protein